MDQIQARLLVVGPLTPSPVPGSPYLLMEDEGRVIVVSGGAFAEICPGGLDDVEAQDVRRALRVPNLTPVYLAPPRTLPDDTELFSEEMNAWAQDWWREYVNALADLFDAQPLRRAA